MNRTFYFIISLLLIVGVILINGFVNQEKTPIPKKEGVTEINSNTFIEISLSGGDFYGGINPSQSMGTIKNNGDAIFSQEYLYSDDIVKTISITRNELEELAKFILDNGFFEMEELYDCRAYDQKCQDRKDHYPPATPLEIDVRIGDLNKTVVVTVYEEGMIDYPENLDKIIEKINEIFAVGVQGQESETQSEEISKTQSDNCTENSLKHEGICKPRIMSLMASQNMEDYLKDTVSHSRIYELTNSNFVVKAQELTKNIDDDYEKVRTIANWVKKSKNYANCNNCNSISEAFQSETGVCNEAALITVAMLRSVGTPSIPVGAPAHVFTAFKIDNRWHGVDSTFCFDKKNCPDVRISKDPLTDNQGREINSVFYIVDNLGSVEQEIGEFCDSFGYCTNGQFTTSRLLLQRNDIPTGTVIFPAIRRLLAVTSGQISCALKPKNFQCDTAHGCYKSTKSEELGESKTGPVSWNKEQWFEVGMEIGESPIGYYLVTLPENKYIYRCIFQNGADIESRRLVAYKEFYLSTGSTTTITYSDLLMGDATEEEFLALKTRIKNITEDLGIYPTE